MAKSVKKLQFAFAPHTYNLLEDLESRTGAASKVEVIRDALSTYNWIVEALEAGKKIEVQRADGSRAEIAFPALSFVVAAKNILGKDGSAAE